MIDLQYGPARIAGDGEPTLNGAEAWAYALGDALGSVRQRPTDGGSVAYVGRHSPFRVKLWTEGNIASAWGCTGEWWDHCPELPYLHNRRHNAPILLATTS